MQRRGMPNQRNAIAWQMMQQQPQQRMGGGMPPMGGGMPQQPMGGGMPPQPMGGMNAGTFGAPITPNTNPMMPHQLTAGEWATGSGDSSPASFANYQAGMGQTPAPAYAGAGSLSAPGSMNMASLNQPFQPQQTAPQLGNGPPLFPTGGS